MKPDLTSKEFDNLEKAMDDRIIDIEDLQRGVITFFQESVRWGKIQEENEKLKAENARLHAVLEAAEWWLECESFIPPPCNKCVFDTGYTCRCSANFYLERCPPRRENAKILKEAKRALRAAIEAAKEKIDANI